MNASPRNVGLVVAAGGRGERVGAREPKQFQAIAGVPMLQRTLAAFAGHPRIAEAVVVLPARYVADPPPWLAEAGHEELRLVEGGVTRAASVALGVAALSDQVEIVLVHDAARPLVRRATIDAVLAAVSDEQGAIAAAPVTDTLKRVSPDNHRIVATVDRGQLWRALTPQGFARRTLVSAYERVGTERDTYTDEAALVEAAGFSVVVVPDTGVNLKVTTPSDLAVAATLVFP